MDWPPTLAEVKDEKRQAVDDDRDDSRLQRCLDAAVSFVERVRGEDFDFVSDPLSTLPAPTADLVLGTLRLAVRWDVRRNSPDGLVSLGELGAGRVPSFDVDIDRLLGIGRFAGGAFA